MAAGVPEAAAASGAACRRPEREAQDLTGRWPVQLHSGLRLDPPLVAATHGGPGPRLLDLLGRLQAEHGRQYWWPASSAFEMAAGAVLVQHTTWAAASRALDALRAAGVLDAAALAAMDRSQLARMLRPAGTYRVKAQRLQALATWWCGHAAGAPQMATRQLRGALLAVPGVGPETADCILLYAFGRPVFVADAYARRLLCRVGIWTASPRPDYETLRMHVQAWLPPDAALLNEAHALIVAHARATCRATPHCRRCVVSGGCGQLTD